MLQCRAPLVRPLRPSLLPVRTMLLSPRAFGPPALTLIGARHLAKGKGKQKGGGKAQGSGNSDTVGSAEDSASSGPKLDEALIKDQMGKPLVQLQREFSAMQTGRAAPSLLDNILVDCGEGGGGQMPLPTLAKVLAQGPQSLQVACYDTAHVMATVAAIERSPLEMRAEQVGKLIKVSVPRPTKESREQLAKHAKVLAEAARTAVRGVRQRAMKMAKSEASKEEIKRAEKKVDAATQEAINLIDATVKVKEKEITTV